MNRVILIGNLTKDVELRKTTKQMSLAKFTIAVKRRGSGQEQATDFINCTAFQQQAEFISKYGEKGRQIAVEGRLQTGKFERDGQTVYTIDVIVDQVQLLGSKPTGTQKNESIEPPTFGGSSTSFDNEFDTNSLDISSDDLPF
jgi:single-strand DNA-binding protein